MYVVVNSGVSVYLVKIHPMYDYRYNILKFHNDTVEISLEQYDCLFLQHLFAERCATFIAVCMRRIIRFDQIWSD